MLQLHYVHSSRRHYHYRRRVVVSSSSHRHIVAIQGLFNSIQFNSIQVNGMAYDNCVISQEATPKQENSGNAMERELLLYVGHLSFKSIRAPAFRLDPRSIIVNLVLMNLLYLA